MNRLLTLLRWYLSLDGGSAGGSDLRSSRACSGTHYRNKCLFGGEFRGFPGPVCLQSGTEADPSAWCARAVLPLFGGRGWVTRPGLFHLSTVDI